MMAPQWLCIGEGEHCSVLVKYLRSSKKVNKVIVNPVPGHHLNDLVAVSRQETQQKGKSFRSIFFCSNTIPGVNIYAAEQWVAVKDEGDPSNFWDETVSKGGTKMAVVIDNEQVQEDINDEVFHAGNQAEDIAVVCNMGFEVDDDNESAPQHILAANALMAVDRGLYEGQRWD
jgi:hypothetical protein